MWTLRTWIVVLALLAAGAFGLASVMATPSERDLVAAQGYKLDLVQHNAHLLIKLDQRENIDVAARMARDPRVAGALEAASSSRTDLQRMQGVLNAALLDLLAQIPAEARPELCIAVDNRGMQIARIGLGQGHIEPQKHGIAGYPLVAEALRGLMRDDTWSLEGKLYLMAASPVVSTAKGAFAGALVLGQEVNVGYAQKLKERLVAAANVPFLARTDIAFFLRGTALAATTAAGSLEKLPLQFVRGRDEYLRAGRSAALRIGHGVASYLAVMAPLPGEAAEHDAFYAIITPAPQASRMLAQIGRLRASDFTDASFLLTWGSLFLALAIGGIAISLAKIDAPMKRLVRDLRRLSRGS